MIVDALKSPDLFGRLPAFADLTTWGAWLVFLEVGVFLAIASWPPYALLEEVVRQTPAHSFIIFGLLIARSTPAIKEKVQRNCSPTPLGNPPRWTDRARYPPRKRTNW